MTSGVYIRTDKIRKALSIGRKKRLKQPMQGKSHSEETKRKMSKSHKGHYTSEVTKRKIGRSNKGRIFSEEFKKRAGIASKKRWEDPKYKERVIRATARGNAKPLTKPEKKLRRGLNKLFPGEYKYVGDGTIIIGCKNPDFINVNGQKKIIELFGDYWHGKNKTGRTKYQEEQQRVEHFAKYGFKTLIVWEHELRDIPKLKRKLRRFNFFRKRYSIRP